MIKEDSLKEIQKKTHNWIIKHGGYWSPLSMLAAIVEEIGELARELNHLEGEKPKKEKSNSSKDRLGEELGDLLFSITCIANYYEIDLNSHFKKIIEKFTTRDANRFI